MKYAQTATLTPLFIGKIWPPTLGRLGIEAGRPTVSRLSYFSKYLKIEGIFVFFKVFKKIRGIDYSVPLIYI